MFDAFAADAIETNITQAGSLARGSLKVQIEFTADVLPQSQGSMKAFVMPAKNGRQARAILTSDNPALKAYRNAVSLSAKKCLGNQTELFAPKHIPVGMRLEFVFERPASVTKKRMFPVVKPDLDKLERAVLDSLTSIVYFDDSQVVEMTARKVYGPRAQVYVQVWTIDQNTMGKLF